MEYIFRYVHPSGTVRFRVLIQRRNMRYQRYFETLDDAIEYRNDLLINGVPNVKWKAPIPTFSVSFN